MNKIAVIIVIILIIVIGAVWFTYARRPINIPATNNPLVDGNENGTNGNYEMIQGMKVEILKEGTGVQAKPGDKVTVNYVGTLENGTKFDSSIDRGTPFPFTLGAGEVIKGWDLGVLGMRVGEKRKLTIPGELAYGSQEIKDSAGRVVIPANSMLIFEVDMLKISQ